MQKLAGAWEEAQHFFS